MKKLILSIFIIFISLLIHGSYWDDLGSTLAIALVLYLVFLNKEQSFQFILVSFFLLLSLFLQQNIINTNEFICISLGIIISNLIVFTRNKTAFYIISILYFTPLVFFQVVDISEYAISSGSNHHFLILLLFIFIPLVSLFLQNTIEYDQILSIGNLISRLFVVTYLFQFRGMLENSEIFLINKAYPIVIAILLFSILMFKKLFFRREIVQVLWTLFLVFPIFYITREKLIYIYIILSFLFLTEANPIFKISEDKNSYLKAFENGALGSLPSLCLLYLYMTSMTVLSPYFIEVVLLYLFFAIVLWIKPNFDMQLYQGSNVKEVRIKWRFILQVIANFIFIFHLIGI